MLPQASQPIPENTDDRAEELIRQVSDRAGNLYMTRQFLCSEAILVAMNEGFGGGLTEQQAVGLSAGMTIGVGGSGCLCGAVSGAVLSLGLLLGGDGAFRHRKEIRDTGNELHNLFKARFRSTCCRVLTKKVKDDEKAHFRQCGELTATAAEMAVRLLLEKRPAMIDRADRAFLERRDSRAGGMLKWVTNFLCR